MLVESLLLSLIGGLAGVVLAEALLKGLVQFLPQNLPRLDEVSLNGTVLAFAVGLSVLTGAVIRHLAGPADLAAGSSTGPARWDKDGCGQPWATSVYKHGS